MVDILFVLMGLPFLGLILSLVFQGEKARSAIVMTISIMMIAAGCFFAYGMISMGGNLQLTIDENIAHYISIGISIIDLLMLIYVIWRGVMVRRYTSPLLAIIQICFLIYLELVIRPHSNLDVLKVDNLSLILILLAAIIGPMILIFAVGYMNEHEKHLNLPKSRQHIFFGIIFFFLFAMVSLAACNNVIWIYTFWELTTLCSFLLIQSDRTDESFRNAFRTLDLNMLGGVAFVIGIILLYTSVGTTSLSELCSIRLDGISGNIVALGIILLCFAGFTKSAMFPFQSWLLGAMVAPTPVSALLHSSTMVKAGVYLVIRLAPVISDTVIGTIVAVAGGFTFVAASTLAISQSNGKRVLAYSTIANLGLIICCAGIGTQASVAAAVLLMIFHAISKGMLFLAVGTIEQKIGSRNIEDMQGLLKLMPFTTFVLATGIMSMLLPPFGVLLTKWIAIESSVYNPIVLIFIILGSAFTVVFWAKWIGIISTMSFKPFYKNEGILPSMKIILGALVFMVISASALVDVLYRVVVKPYVMETLNAVPYMANLRLESITGGLQILGPNGMYVGGFAVAGMFIVILLFVLVIPSIIHNTNFEKVRPPYFGGELANNDIRGIDFIGPMDREEHVIVRNYYFNNIFGGSILNNAMMAVAIAILLVLFGVII